MPRDESSRLLRIKANLERRSLILECTRSFFCNEGFLEVETPLVIETIAPEQHIAPLRVDGRFLSTSPEMQMKRLLAAGYTRIFQICHCFRKSEKGQWHNPEFTMLEWYRIDADYLKIIDDTEKLVHHISNELGFASAMRYQGKHIDLSIPWPKITVREAFSHFAGWDPFELLDPERFDDDTVEKVIPGFAPNRPTVLMDYPVEMASLARLRQSSPPVAERAEVFIGGLEIANAYSELTDVVEQERRFKQEIESMKKEGKRDFAMPRRFLDAMSGLPQCGGNALGIDRLVMLFCDAASIDEVIPFPWGTT